MIAMAFPTPNGLRAEWPRRRENPSSSGRWRRQGFLDFGYPWQEAGTLGCCHTGYRVGDWHPLTDANCDHSSSICTRGKSIQRNRACLLAGYRGFVIIRTSKNVRSDCGACLASFGSVPRETVLYNSAYFPEQVRHAVGIVFTISLWGLRWSCFSPWLEEQPVRNRFTMDLAAFSFPSAMPRRWPTPWPDCFPRMRWCAAWVGPRPRTSDPPTPT